MSSPIQPGDIVEYLGPTDPAGLPVNILTVGAHYVVEGIEEGIGCDGDLYEGFALAGFDDWCFAPTSFRLVGGDPSTTSKTIPVLQPAPERALEDA